MVAGTTSAAAASPAEALPTNTSCAAHAASATLAARNAGTVQPAGVLAGCAASAHERKLQNAPLPCPAVALLAVQDLRLHVAPAACWEVPSDALLAKQALCKPRRKRGATATALLVS